VLRIGGSVPSSYFQRGGKHDVLSFAKLVMGEQVLCSSIVDEDMVGGHAVYCLRTLEVRCKKKASVSDGNTEVTASAFFHSNLHTIQLTASLNRSQ